MRYLKHPRWPVLLVALTWAMSGVVPAQTNNLIIYHDGLRNGFRDWSWSSRNLTSTDQVHSGSISISVSAKPWEGLFLRRSGSVNTTNYEALSFWVHGGEQGGQLLMVRPVWGGQAQEGTVLPELPSDRWQQFTVPFTDLNLVNRTNFQGFELQLCAGVTNTFYVDDVQLDAKPAPPVAEAAAKVTAASQSAPVQPAIPPVAPPPVAAAPIPDRVVGWVIGSLAVIIGLLGFLVFLFWRKGDGTSGPRPNLSLSTRSALPGGAAAESLSVDDWKQRALVAEAMAGQQGQMLREKIMPELTEFAKQSLVQGLYAQRNALLERQQKAQQALAAFESRLAALQLPLQERVRAYEKRIVELEKEVETQGEEMRELTRATLALVRKKLEDEQERGRLPGRFN